MVPGASVPPPSLEPSLHNTYVKLVRIQRDSHPEAAAPPGPPRLAPLDLRKPAAIRPGRVEIRNCRQS
eukprot:5541351-Alexandrium_andersonii.AAC.1